MVFKSGLSWFPWSRGFGTFQCEKKTQTTPFLNNPLPALRQRDKKAKHNPTALEKTGLLEGCMQRSTSTRPLKKRVFWKDAFCGKTPFRKDGKTLLLAQSFLESSLCKRLGFGARPPHTHLGQHFKVASWLHTLRRPKFWQQFL